MEPYLHVCAMTSAGFPERTRICYIGPITVQYFPATDLSTKTIPNLMNQVKPIESEEELQSIGCEISCRSEDDNNTVLLFTFLTTTIILCCKHQQISMDITRAQRDIPVNDGGEPVYVSQQRRRDNERNSMYMAVEDPTNPGNKVVMPREVF